MTLLGNTPNNRVPQLMAQVSILARQLIVNVVEIELHNGCICARGGPQEVSIVVIARRNEDIGNDLDIQTKHDLDCPLYTDETMEETFE